MNDECPMTEDCPGYDRERRACLVRPRDCEFAAPDRDTDVVFETSDAPPAGGPPSSATSA